jgi:hypothetical protein
MRAAIILFGIVAIGIAGAALVLPLRYGFVYVGYVGCCVAGLAAVYGVVESVRVVAGRPPLLRPIASTMVLVVLTCVAAIYLHDELLPTSGYSLDTRLMTKGHLIISEKGLSITSDSPSPSPRKSP